MTRRYLTLVLVATAWLACGAILMLWLNVLPLWAWMTLGIVVMLWLNVLAWWWSLPTPAERHLLETLRHPQVYEKRIYVEVPDNTPTVTTVTEPPYQGSALLTYYRNPNVTSDPLKRSSVPTTGTTPRPSGFSGVNRESGPTA